MEDKKNGDDSLQTYDKPSTELEPKKDIAESCPAALEDVRPIATEAEKPAALEATKQANADRPPLLPAGHEPRRDEEASPVAASSVSAKKRQSFFAERPLPAIEMAPRILRYRSRRDFLVFGTGALAVLTGAGFLLPQETLSRIGIHRSMDSPAKEWFLNRALRIDDDVAEALYSVNRRVPTYTKSQITPLKNNYNGSTPGPAPDSGRQRRLGHTPQHDRGVVNAR